MITKDNLKEIVNGLTMSEKNRIKQTVKEFIVLELHIFNVGSYTTIKLTDDYNRYKNVSDNGNCILETHEVIDLLEDYNNIPNIMPTVKNFKILQTERSTQPEAVTKKNFICPKIYDNKNAYYYTFKNGIKAVIIKCTKEEIKTLESGSNNVIMQGIQTTHYNDNYDFLIQHSAELKSCIAIFTKF